MFRGIRLRLAMTYIIVIVVSMSVVGLFLTHWLRQYYITSMEEILSGQGTFFAGFFERYLGNQADLSTVAQTLATQFASEARARVQVLGPGGELVGDSQGTANLRHVLSTPAIKTAFKGQVGQDILVSPHKQDILEVAVPIKVGRVIGVVRLSSSLHSVNRTMLTVWHLLATGTAIALVVAALIGYILGQTVTRPLSEIASVAREMSTGNLKVRAVKRYRDEVGQLADTINHMADELGQLEAMRAEFIGSVSHELKTPLTSIKGYVITVMDSLENQDPELLRYLQVIDRETDRLTRMVEDLLDVARSQAGQMHLDRQAMDLVPLLEGIMEQVTLRADRQGVTLEYVPKTTHLEIVGDRDRLKQVFLNLLDNAFKFSEENNEVRVLVWEADGRAYVSIEDQGSGIAADELSKIFERFYRAPRLSKKVGGSGLGLAIVRDIVQGHGGEIKATSEKGRGTTMTVWLPLQV